MKAVPPRGSLADEAVEAIAEYGLDVAPITLGNRAAFIHALTAGQTAQEYEPTSKAASEIQRFYMQQNHILKLSQMEILTSNLILSFINGIVPKWVKFPTLFHERMLCNIFAWNSLSLNLKKYQNFGLN